MNYQTLFNQWMQSYRRDPNHALRDASKNLKGFKLAMQDALQRFSTDYAFSVAIRATLRKLA